MQIEKKCEWCGKAFVSNSNNNRFYCSKNCADKASQYRCGGSQIARLNNEQKLENGRRIRERREMMRKLAKRDAAYAAQFPASASGNIRGRTIIGGHFAVRNYNPVV